jgi:DNA-binding MarR family transcriptional regulator
MQHISVMKMTASGRELVSDVSRGCLLTRARQISRVLTGIYDQELRPFGINSPQFTLLVMIARLGPVSRAEVGRQNHQERSTLTRNLQLLISEGWVEEVSEGARGRIRPLVLTESGRELLDTAGPAWRAAQRSAKKILGEDGADSIVSMAGDLPQLAN